MPTYITLIHWTQPGLQTVKNAPARLDAAKRAIQAAGGERKALYLVMGQYDFVLITEFPNDEVAARFAIGNAMQGHVRTETMRAFTEDEYRKIVASLP